MGSEDGGAWFVRVIHNKVAVGVFACPESQLATLIDEAVEPAACEYKKLPIGGFIFRDEPVLHEASGEPHFPDAYLTESWDIMYADDGLWRRLNTPPFANDE
ncbi:hypothetical protein HNO88_004430 [Novosphingobium chloroacetimidivorans]|uniref:Uncharacterized protein n=1 Tax=Novosphingobium chloroacetimidivorans TaxID=1428314 RepID=A0A7W7KER2_9SPHN|nr:hypothetical protein [Novosphingobium chloroacetimidivorans]MBB4861076.1 hypothetical protein [Novosphingobium chloroacetimidivorans]